jgi:tetratricopeptide (TPR) repeat protein
MRNTVRGVRSLVILTTLSLIQAIAFTLTSLAIDKTSQSRFKIESQELSPIFLISSKSAGQEADSYFRLGVQKAVKQDYRGGLVAFDRAIQLNPNFSYAYNGRGAIKAEINDLQGALFDFVIK